MLSSSKEVGTGVQQKYEETKKLQKMTHDAITPLSGEKPKVHPKPGGLRIQPSGQMSMDQLIKVVLNLQKEVKILRKENTKLIELINNGLQDTLDLRMLNQEREIDAL